MEPADAKSARLSLDNSEVLGRVITVNPYVKGHAQQQAPKEEQQQGEQQPPKEELQQGEKAPATSPAAGQVHP